jgi:hypothetical protein
MDSDSPYPVVVLLTVVGLSIVGLAFLAVLGTALYGMVMALSEALASLWCDARDRLRGASSGSRLAATDTPEHTLNSQKGARAEPAELSTEALWHSMQGTSKKARRSSIAP